MQSFGEVLPKHPDWSRFIEECWGRKPFLFRNVLPHPLFAEEDLLQAYRAAFFRQSEALCVGANFLPGSESCDRNVIVYLEQPDLSWSRKARAADLIRLLPGPDDVSCRGYVERILKQEHCAGVAAHLRYNLLGYNPALLAPAEELAMSVFEKTGFPGDWTLDSYLGKYASTAFGVHKDETEDQLYVSPLAEKTILLWSTEDWESIENYRQFSRQYAGHPVAPIRLRIGPQDVAYWPHHYYHIGESPEVALSVQINLRPRFVRLGRLAEGLRVASLLSYKVLGYRAVKPSSVGQAQAGADEMKAFRLELQALLDDPVLSAELEIDMLRRQSAHFVSNHFDGVSELFALKLPRGKADASRFEVQTRRRPIWLLRPKSVVIAVNGTLAELKCGREWVTTLDAALHEICRGAQFTAQELAARLPQGDATEADRRIELVQDLIQRLHELGGIVGIS